MISASMVAKTIQGAMTIAEKEKNFELVEKLRELQGELLDLRENYQSLKEENATLKKEKDSKIEFEQKYTYDVNKYILKNDPNNQNEFLCSCCLDNEQKKIHLSRTEDETLTTFRCPVCKHQFVIADELQRQRQVSIRNRPIPNRYAGF